MLDALVRGGHDVTALVRDNEKAARVAARGGHPVVGNLAEPESYRAAADAQDGYMHTAFDAASGRGPAIDRIALDTMIAAAKRPRTAGATAPRARFIIYTSGVWVLGRTLRAGGRRRAGQPDPDRRVASRPRRARARGGHRRPAHDGRPARRRLRRRRTAWSATCSRSASNGLVRVVGDGNNHWPLVYDRDLADLYARLVGARTPSGVYHANDEGDERVNDIVDAIAPYVAVRPDVRHVPIEEARAKMGPFADALSLDQVVRSPRARALGWTPTLRSVGGNAARLLEEWRSAS